MSGDTRAPRSALGAWLTASTINSAGTVATASVLPIVIFRATRNPAAVSLLAVIEAGPYLLLGIATGYLADRTNRQRLIAAGFAGAAAEGVGRGAARRASPRLRPGASAGLTTWVAHFEQPVFAWRLRLWASGNGAG